MVTVFCEYRRNTCAHRRKERQWIPIELAKIYKKKKIVKFVKIDGKPKTKTIKNA